MKKPIGQKDSVGDEIRADYRLFIDIQMGKYLRSKNKSEFDSDDEAKFIMSKVIEAYNQKIASNYLRLDNLNEAAKVSWFNSVEIDFENTLNQYLPVENIPFINKETRDFISYYNNLFPFLPEGAIIYLINAGPALEAYAYPMERFKKIIEGEETTEIEEDLLLWAYNIAFEVSQSYLEKNKVKKEKLLANSITIAEEELDEKTALNVVSQIYANYKESFTELHKKKKNKKKKK